MTASDHLKHRTGSLGGDQIPEDLMTDEQLDAELRSYGISESDIDKQLARIKKAIKEKTPTISEQLTHSKEDWKERAFAAEAALAQKTREDARRTSEYWKAEHLAGNKEIDALKAQVEQLGRQVAEMDAERRLLWTALTDVVSVERVNALSDAVIASRARTK